MEHKLPEPPLPELEVLQTTYCGQAMTDLIIRFIHENKPNLVLDLLETYYAGSIIDYRNLFSDVVDYLRGDAFNALNVSPPRLAMIDVLFEIHRRVAKAANVPGWPMPAIRGNPIAAGLGKPLQKLAVPPVTSRRKFYAVDQKTTNEVLEYVYKTRPELWYETAECERRDIPAIEQFREFFDCVKAMDGSISGVLIHTLSSEMHRRVLVMAGLWGQDGQPKQPLQDSE